MLCYFTSHSNCVGGFILGKICPFLLHIGGDKISEREMLKTIEIALKIKKKFRLVKLSLFHWNRKKNSEVFFLFLIPFHTRDIFTN